MTKIYKLVFNADYYYDKAADYTDEGNLVPAIYNYYRSLSLEPFNPWTMSDIGACYLELGLMSDALEWFNRALAIDKKCSSAAFGIVQIMAAAGKYKAAERLVPLCSREDLDGYLESGEFFDSSAFLGSSDDGLFRIVDKDAGNRLLTSALSALQIGDVACAEEKLRRVDEKSKAYCEAAYYLALILYDRGDYEGALVVSERMIAVCSCDVKTYIIRIVVCLKLNMTEESERACSKLEKLEPGDFAECIGVAFCLSDIGLYDFALGFYEHAVKLQPYHKTALLLCALCLHNTGNADKCREAFVRACKLYPEDGLLASYARFTYENPNETIPLVSDLGGRTTAWYVGKFLQEIKQLKTVERIEEKYDEDDSFYDRMMGFLASGAGGAVEGFVQMISPSKRLRPICRELLVRENSSTTLKIECLTWLLVYEKRKEFALLEEDGTVGYCKASVVGETDDTARSVYCLACAATKIARIDVDRQLKNKFALMKKNDYEQLCDYETFRENAAWLCSLTLGSEAGEKISKLIGADEAKFSRLAEKWENIK